MSHPKPSLTSELNAYASTAFGTCLFLAAVILSLLASGFAVAGFVRLIADFMWAVWP